MQELLQTVIFGLSLGGVIAVGAVGLTLSYGVTGFINFAYGELLTIGAYAGIALGSTALPLPLTIVAATLVGGAASVIIARTFYEPLRGKSALALLMTSIGVAFILQNVIQIVFGADPAPFPIPLLRPWDLGAVFVPKIQIAVFGVALLAMGGIYVLLKSTLLGRKMRATSANEALARVSGINTIQTVRSTWFISGLVGGLAGVLLAASQSTVSPTIGFKFLLVVFAATLLGGIGNPYGAMLGAMVVGVGIQLGTTYVSADYGNAVAFLILILVLLLRPSGILGGSAISEQEA